MEKLDIINKENNKLNNQNNNETKGKKDNNNGKNRKKQIFTIILVVILLLVVIALAIYIFKQIKTNKQEESPIQKVEQTQEEVVVEEKSERVKRLEELKSMNPEIVGILEIDDTNINYPVVQAKDNDYYLKRNFKKEIAVKNFGRKYNEI